MHCSFHGSLFDLLVRHLPAGGKSMIECFMQVHDHDNAGFDCNSEQSNVPDPNRHAEVVAKQPLENQSAGHGVKRWKNQHESLSDGMKDHIEQEENDKEHHPHDDLQPLFGSKLELIFA